MMDSDMKALISPVYKRLEDDLNPFGSDPYGRKTFANNLTALLKNTDDGLVLSINAEWGEGKTSFVKMLELRLKNEQQFIPIYYDAFQNDFSNDPFLSIAVEIHKSLQKELIKEKKDVEVKSDFQLDRLKEQTKKLAIEFVKMGTGLATSQLTAGLVDSQTISNWTGEAVKKILFGTLEEKMDAKFNAHLDALSSIAGYQDQLKEILKIGNPIVQRKIVFFVDELDRCRPDFAIQVIEKIKHLFNIENVFFVLAINKKQLENTIKAAYGIDEADAHIYLQKFIDLETDLPSIRSREFEHVDRPLPDLKNYIKNLSELHGIDKHFTKHCLDCSSLAELVNQPELLLNPRSIERAFTLITVGLWSTTPESQINTAYLKALCAMAVLKVAKPDLYKKSRAGYIDEMPGDLFECLERFLDSTDNVATPSAKRFKSPAVFQVCQILDIYSVPFDYD
jgi:hypothetical protein